MPRKSEVDKIIEKNIDTFDKYEMYEVWKRKHFKAENDKKYKEAWEKCYNVTEPTELDDE